MLAVLGASLVEGIATWSRAGRLGGRVIVRCAQGHLFSTIWIPAVSFKAIRLGSRRFQRCPVGRHWSSVRPVNERDLTEDEIRSAREHRDLPIP